MTAPVPPPAPPRLTLPRLLRTLALAGGLAALWIVLPGLILKIEGVGPQPAAVAIEQEPTYLDAAGEPVNEATHRMQLGYDMARAQQIDSHADCRRRFEGAFESGCHRHVTERRIPPRVRQGNWNGGKTTAQCEAEVNAYWSAMTRDQREQGDEHAAQSWTRRSWMPELRECANYDKVRIGKVVHEPAMRLDALLRKLEEGGKATDEDQAEVRRDLVRVSSFPDGPAKRAYLAKADLFFQRAGGR